MKVFEKLNPKFGKAFHERISPALRKYSPESVEWVDKEEDADYILVHTVGGEEFVYMLSKPLNKIINFQHCFLTVKNIEIEDWESIWENTLINISFHDFNWYTDKKIRKCVTPLGADTSVFVNKKLTKKYDVFGTGHVAETELLDVVYKACKTTGKTFLHTGHNFKWEYPTYIYRDYMPITTLVDTLNQTRYISALRDVEGFELMGIEGALCGAVPIVPNLRTYYYYSGFGYFIDMRYDPYEQIVELLNSDYEELTDEQIDRIKEKFNWEKIVKNIFNKIQEYI